MTIHLGSGFTTILWCYIVVTGIVSLYHGYRGYVNQRTTAQGHQNLTERTPPQSGIPDKWYWSPAEVLVVRCLYDALFYAFCSVAGFAALWLAGYVLNTIPDLRDIPGGTSAFLVFLVVLGLLGVSGQLSYLIQLGKLPR